MEFACPTCGERESTYFPDVPCVKRACCEICAEFDREQLSVCWDDRKLQKSFKQHYKHLMEFHRRIKHTHEGNGAPTGPFAFTLNMAPTDGLTKDDMIVAARKIMGQLTKPVTKYAWYLEYGDNETKEHPHIHGMYETRDGGRIPARQFKRAWPIWDESQRLGRGHRGGYHDVVRNGEGYSSYIKEDVALNEIWDHHGF